MSNQITWDLKIWPCYNAVLYGPDQGDRSLAYIDLINKYANDPSKVCLQVGVMRGADGKKIGTNFVSIDLYDTRPCIDFNEDLAATHFPDNHFDLIVCNAILEHVKDPFACAREMYRICKPDGLVWAEVPFVQPYHPRKDYKLEFGYLDTRDNCELDINHGGDYWRFTPQGTVELMKGFTVLRLFLINEGGIAFHGIKK